MEEIIDLNEIGRLGYKILQNNKLVESELSKLTLTQRTELIAKLESMLADILYNKVTEKNEKKVENTHKYNFLMFLYSSLICYLDNTDLNKFINIKPKK